MSCICLLYFKGLLRTGVCIQGDDQMVPCLESYFIIEGMLESMGDIWLGKKKKNTSGSHDSLCQVFEGLIHEKG